MPEIVRNDTKVLVVEDDKSLRFLANITQDFISQKDNRELLQTSPLGRQLLSQQLRLRNWLFAHSHFNIKSDAETQNKLAQRVLDAMSAGTPPVTDVAGALEELKGRRIENTFRKINDKTTDLGDYEELFGQILINALRNAVNNYVDLGFMYGMQNTKSPASFQCAPESRWLSQWHS